MHGLSLERCSKPDHFTRTFQRRHEAIAVKELYIDGGAQLEFSVEEVGPLMIAEHIDRGGVVRTFADFRKNVAPMLRISSTHVATDDTSEHDRPLGRNVGKSDKSILSARQFGW